MNYGPIEAKFDVYDDLFGHDKPYRRTILFYINKLHLYFIQMTYYYCYNNNRVIVTGPLILTFYNGF